MNLKCIPFDKNGFDVHMMVDGIPTINSCKLNNRLPENELKTYTVGQKMPRSHDFLINLN